MRENRSRYANSRVAPLVPARCPPPRRCRTRALRRTSPSRPVWRRPPAGPAAPPRRRFPRRAASRDRRSAPVPGAAAPSCARVRSSGGRPATTARRRAPAFGHQCGRGHHDAVEQHRRAPHRGLGQEAGHRGQVGAAADPQQRKGIRRRRRGPGTAHRGSRRSCGPSPRRRRRCPGRPPRRVRCRSARRSTPSPAWCSRCPCRRRSAGRRRRRPLRRRSRGRPRPRRRPRPRSARPRRRCCRCRAEPCERRSPATAVRRCRRRCPRPARSAPADLGQHVDGRAAASMFATIWAVTSGGYAETPAAATPWSPANTTTRGPLELLWRANALAGRHPHREFLEPAQRSGRLGQRSCRARAAASASRRAP